MKRSFLIVICLLLLLVGCKEIDISVGVDSSFEDIIEEKPKNIEVTGSIWVNSLRVYASDDTFLYVHKSCEERQREYKRGSVYTFRGDIEELDGRVYIVCN